MLSYFRPIVISMGEGGANTSCPGQRERCGWPSRGRWAVLSTGRVFARRNEDEHPDWRHYRPVMGGQCKSFPSAKTLTAAACIS